VRVKVRVRVRVRVRVKVDKFTASDTADLSGRTRCGLEAGAADDFRFGDHALVFLPLDSRHKKHVAYMLESPDGVYITGKCKNDDIVKALTLSRSMINIQA